MKKTRIHHSVKKEDLGTSLLYDFSPSALSSQDSEEKQLLRLLRRKKSGSSFLTHLEGENIPANRYEDEEAE